MEMGGGWAVSALQGALEREQKVALLLIFHIIHAFQMESQSVWMELI